MSSLLKGGKSRSKLRHNGSPWGHRIERIGVCEAPTTDDSRADETRADETRARAPHAGASNDDYPTTKPKHHLARRHGDVDLDETPTSPDAMSATGRHVEVPPPHLRTRGQTNGDVHEMAGTGQSGGRPKAEAGRREGTKAGEPDGRGRVAGGAVARAAREARREGRAARRAATVTRERGRPGWREGSAEEEAR